jgi:hypothetical protein
MFNLEFEQVLEEVKSAEKRRDNILEQYETMLKEYEGTAYNGPTTESAFSNHSYEWQTLMGPRLAHDRPKAKTSTRRPGSQTQVAEAIKHGLDRWSHDTDFGEDLHEAAFDYGFVWCAAMVHERPLVGQRVTGDRMWPACEIIDPRRIIVDQFATNTRDAKFVGHMWIRDKDDLIEEAEGADESEGWDLKLLRSVTPDTALEKLGREGNSSEREEVIGYTLWVPSYQSDDAGPDDGIHGGLLTFVLNGQGGGYLKKPMPFYGPKWGPYQLAGAHRTRSSPWPFGPLYATKMQADELNKQWSSILVSAHAYKKVVATDKSGDPDAGSKLNKPGEYHIQLENFDQSQPVQLEVAGISDMQLRMVNVFAEALNESSGMDGAQRGVAEGRGLATEVAIADKTSGIRTEGIKRPFTRFANSILRTVAWYLYYDDRIEFALGPDAAEAMGMVEPWFFGGDFEEGSGATFDDLEIEIETMSMSRSTEGLVQARTMQAFQLITSTLPLRRQYPEADWKALDSMIGDSLNIPQLGTMVDQELANQLAGLEPLESSQDTTQPRLGRDVGAASESQAIQRQLVPGVGPGQNGGVA